MAFLYKMFTLFFCILQLTENDIFVIIKMDFYFMKKKQFRKGVET